MCVMIFNQEVQNNKTYYKEYYLKNKDKILKTSRKWYKNNREYHNAICYLWRQIHGREKWLKCQNRYNELNPPVTICYGEEGNRKEIFVRSKSKKLPVIMELVKNEQWDKIEQLRKKNSETT